MALGSECLFFLAPFLWYQCWKVAVGQTLDEVVPIQIHPDTYHEATGLDPVNDPVSTAMMMNMGEL